MSSYSKVYIFDFDGTLVKSNSIKEQAFLRCLPELDDVKLRRFITQTPGDRINIIKAAHNSIFHNDRVMSLEERVENFNDYTTRLISCAAEVLDAQKFLKRSKENGIRLFISSATPTFHLKNILKNRKLASFFDEILGSPETKVDHVRKIKNSLIEREGKDRQELEITYFGDSEQDLLCSLKTDIDFHGIFHDFLVPKWALAHPYSFNFRRFKTS